MGQAGNTRVARNVKKNMGHTRDPRFGRRFNEIVCPTCQFKMKVGEKPVPTCGKCKGVIPRNGWV